MKCIYDGIHDPLLLSNTNRADSLLRTAAAGQIRERVSARRVISRSELQPFVMNGKWTGDATSPAEGFSLISEGIQKQMAKMIAHGDLLIPN